MKLNVVLPMTNCNPNTLQFPPLKRRKIQAEFSGGDITSDAGVMLLRQIDHRLGLLQSVNQQLPDPRDPKRITHSQLSLLRQRVYGLCMGYEDLIPILINKYYKEAHFLVPIDRTNSG